MSDFLFQHRSPLIGWFILVEILTATWIGGYWYALLRQGVRPWDNPELGALVTGLFIVSNVLLFRHRRWAVVCFIVCWSLLGLLALPTI